MAPAVPQRNTLIFVVSILLLIGAAVDLISVVSLLGLLGVAGGAVAGVVVFSVIFAVVATAYLAVVGVLGLQNAAKPEKADLLFKLGIGLCAVSLISLIFDIASGGGVFYGIVGFLLPVLFVYGAMTLRKQAPAV